MSVPNPGHFNPLKMAKNAQKTRQQKGMSIEKLARLSGVNKNTIVRFEKGMSSRLDTVFKICQALATTPFDLSNEKLVKGKDYDIKKRHRDKDGKPIWQHVKPTTASQIHKEDPNVLIGDTNFTLPGGQINAVILEIIGTSRLRSHVGEEMIFCLAGKVGFKLGDEETILESGDSAFFYGSEIHNYWNADDSREVSIALSIWIDDKHDLSSIIFY
ncbi:helix-turn-helix transcriptional regulator [bacterium]|nr:helix-turn-helix transcriptional regulator [bacterium]